MLVNFSSFERDGSPELPYGSVFYTSNADGTYTYDITAPKTYKDKGKNFSLCIGQSDSDPGCNNLVIKAYNIERRFQLCSV